MRGGVTRLRARHSVKYFIPDWNDYVDEQYDFFNEVPAGRRVYAHECLDTPPYDGVLISRAAVNVNKLARIVTAGGIRQFLRVPDELTVLGDCGAFGYIDQEVPTYETSEIIDYYTHIGVDLGVSIDHLIITSEPAEQRRRYDLTIANAEAFLLEYQARGLAWEPVGAVQGWDASSYAAAARAYVAMGYRYLALGTLVRRGDRELMAIITAVRDVCPDIRLHLFGVGRLQLVPAFARMGVTSMDSASHLRRAWLRADQNYFTEEGWYSSIRVPIATTLALAQLESACMAGVREVAEQRTAPPRALIDALVEYETQFQPLAKPERRRDQIARILTDRPWERCACAMCRAHGVEIAIFRRSNRSRRRGFHNTYVFYRLFNSQRMTHLT